MLQHGCHNGMRFYQAKRGHGKIFREHYAVMRNICQGNIDKPYAKDV